VSLSRDESYHTALRSKNEELFMALSLLRAEIFAVASKARNYWPQAVLLTSPIRRFAQTSGSFQPSTGVPSTVRWLAR
jgi:hypothetical protein